ncbi:MAG: hypothetical protein ISN26_04950 [Betaproteobacteria bacterium AqS2]|uniref:Apea-like HEPN domain-containing protein n=1 Tax=Candidatus Amphirhobacter heronislandensis TaxID=1732024 RepID=A0A930UHM8_9GAMM|nr:hypothetical protein [Betaproteobacteria bacterium AqS2]
MGEAAAMQAAGGNRPYLEEIEALDELRRKVFSSVGDYAILPHEEFTAEKSNMIRMQRALSWLRRYAEDEVDKDIGFILHWIAFESLYGREENSQYSKHGKVTTAKEIEKFFDELKATEMGRVQLVEATITIIDDIRAAFANPYISTAAWYSYYSKKVPRAGGRHNPFAAEKPRPCTQSKLKDPKQYDAIIREVFLRMYLVRNQLFHGNATYKGHDDSEKSAQIVSGYNILRQLMPPIISIMLRSMEEDPASERWGLVPYPRIKDK